MRTDHEYTIRRADPDALMMGEYTFLAVAGPDDWERAEDESIDHDTPTEYVIEKWEKVGEWRRTFAEPSIDEDEDA